MIYSRNIVAIWYDPRNYDQDCQYVKECDQKILVPPLKNEEFVDIEQGKHQGDDIDSNHAIRLYFDHIELISIQIVTI